MRNRNDWGWERRWEATFPEDEERFEARLRAEDDLRRYEQSGEEGGPGGPGSLPWQFASRGWRRERDWRTQGPVRDRMDRERFVAGREGYGPEWGGPPPRRDEWTPRDSIVEWDHNLFSREYGENLARGRQMRHVAPDYRRNVDDIRRRFERGEQTPRGFRGRGPRNYQRSDERIHEDVMDALSFQDDIDASDISVEVHDGEVVLKGMVENRFDKRLAEDLVSDLRGVKDVRNEIRVRRKEETTERSVETRRDTQPRTR